MRFIALLIVRFFGGWVLQSAFSRWGCCPLFSNFTFLLLSAVQSSRRSDFRRFLQFSPPGAHEESSQLEIV